MPCRALVLLAALVVLSGCGPSRAARTSLEAGQRAMAARAFRPALTHFRAAVTDAPDYATAHVARGEAAETLGEFDEALAAYQAAAALAPAHRVPLGSLAERMGQEALALQTLEGADGPWYRHALVGGVAGATALTSCVAHEWLLLWRQCLPGSLSQARAAYRGSRDAVAAYRLQILIETGQRERALALASSRGWVRENLDYCGPSDVPVSRETAALLAMLLHPKRADCVLAVGTALGDDGLVRLARLLLRDRAERSQQAEVRAQATWFLRYRLPAENPTKLAESLNVIGWRLQHRFKNPGDAFAVFQKAIAADPSFSWPYQNIGRIYIEHSDHAEARRWLLRALAVNPNDWPAQFGLGVASHHLQHYDEALAAYARAARMNPNDADTHANLGWVLLKLGRKREAIRELQTAVQLNPALDAERRYLAAAFGQNPRQTATPLSLR